MGALDGLRALVTGAGSGIGEAISRGLAAEGAELVLVGRNLSTLQQLGLAGEVFACDVTDEDAVARLAADVGPIDILINNAGAAESAPLARTTTAMWQRMLNVNATGAFFMCRAFAPGMAARGSGRIVNIASTAGERGYAYISAYCASKHALVGLTRSLALELASAGVTVNAVCPGYTETPLLERSVAGIVAATGRDAERAREALLADGGQARFVQPAEVAVEVCWLCEPAQASFTGQTVTIAGDDDD